MTPPDLTLPVDPGAFLFGEWVSHAGFRVKVLAEQVAGVDFEVVEGTEAVIVVRLSTAVLAGFRRDQVWPFAFLDDAAVTVRTEVVPLWLKTSKMWRALVHVRTSVIVTDPIALSARL